MYVNPGELNKKIQIVKKSNEKDLDGFPTGENELIRQCYAKYSKKDVSEKDSAGSDIMTTTIRFLIRYTHVRIDSNMKIIYDGETYDIQTVNDINGEHRYIELFVKRGEL